MGKTKSRGNGEGTIYYIDSKKLWACQYKVDGKRKTLYGKTKKAVKEKLEKLIVQATTDTFVDKSSVTGEEIARKMAEDDYKSHLILDNTYLRRIGTINAMSGHNVMLKPIQNVTGADIKDFFQSIVNYLDSYIKKFYGMLNSIFKFAVSEKILAVNPLDDKRRFKRPNSSKQTRKVSAFTIEEQKLFIEAIKGHKFELQFLLSMFCGLRMGEVNALTASDIDIDTKKITIRRTITRDLNEYAVIGKTTKTYAGQRTVYMTDELCSKLSQLIKGMDKDELLFKRPNGSPYTTNMINMSFHRICENCGIENKEINQHMLRHTFATRCIESGMPAQVLQKLLGHTDITTTINTYCDIFDEYRLEHTDTAFQYMQKVLQ